MSSLGALAKCSLGKPMRQSSPVVYSKSCGKWRLVEPGALASLTGEKYRDVVECAKDAGWKEWLAGAEKRYEDFLKVHGMVR